VVSGGGLVCWGSNLQYQLGRPTQAAVNPTAAPVSGISGAVAVGAGGDHTCAIVTGGAMQCFGGNDNGQLGNGTGGSGQTSSTPVGVSGPLSDATYTGGGANFTCALLSSRAVKCWGDDGLFGQLGKGTTGSSSTPVDVVGVP
jgi:alpha-tubulin suppressor-like RCC1 family protein